MEVESITSKPFTINQRASSLSEQNKSALTDHASHDNHVINWLATSILDRKSNKTTRQIKEAVHIQKETTILEPGHRFWIIPKIG